MGRPLHFRRNRAFGFLRIVRLAGKAKGYGRLWETECEQYRRGEPCGRLRLVAAMRLTSGQVIACEECTREMKSDALRQAAVIRRERKLRNSPAAGARP